MIVYIEKAYVCKTVENKKAVENNLLTLSWRSAFSSYTWFTWLTAATTPRCNEKPSKKGRLSFKANAYTARKERNQHLLITNNRNNSQLVQHHFSYTARNFITFDTDHSSFIKYYKNERKSDNLSEKWSSWGWNYTFRISMILSRENQNGMVFELSHKIFLKPAYSAEVPHFEKCYLEKLGNTALVSSKTSKKFTDC